jgi:hypothetical protein
MYFRVRILFLALAASAAASGADLLKREAFGTIGLGRIYDDEGSLGQGLNGGGGFGYRLSPRFGVEAGINAFRTSREFSSAYPAYRANGVLLSGSGLLYFGHGIAQPYLALGAGLLHYRNVSDFSGMTTGRSSNGLAVNAGFGLRIFATRQISIRPEVRIYGGRAGNAVPAPFADLRLSIGAGYHW